MRYLTNGNVSNQKGKSDLNIWMTAHLADYHKHWHVVGSAIIFSNETFVTFIFRYINWSVCNCALKNI